MIPRWLVAGLRRLTAAVMPTTYVPYTHAPVAGWAGIMCSPLGPVAFVATDGEIIYRW
jgi:hypothetical protein